MALPTPSATFLLPRSNDAAPAPSRPANLVTIDQLRPGRTNFDVEVIVLDCHDRRPYLRRQRRPGQPGYRAPPPGPDGTQGADEVILYVFHVADRSGSIVLNVFQHDGEYLNSGDIIWISGAYAKIYEETESLQLYAGPKAPIRRIGEDTLEFRVAPNWSHFTWVTDPADPQALRSVPPPETEIALHWFPRKNRQALGHKLRPGDLRPDPSTVAAPAKPVQAPAPAPAPPAAPLPPRPTDPRRRNAAAAAASVPPANPPTPVQPIQAAPSTQPRDPRLAPAVVPQAPPVAQPAPASAASGASDARTPQAAAQEIGRYVSLLAPFYPSRQAVLDIVQEEAKRKPDMSGEDLLRFVRGLYEERRKTTSLGASRPESMEVQPGEPRQLAVGGNSSFAVAQQQSGRRSPPSVPSRGPPDSQPNPRPGGYGRGPAPYERSSQPPYDRGPPAGGQYGATQQYDRDRDRGYYDRGPPSYPRDRERSPPPSRERSPPSQYDRPPPAPSYAYDSRGRGRGRGGWDSSKRARHG
ncbi:hypothetical protein DFJ74DRAFT_674693 [Hyaloraphidium curvatum]|nr:hypothetical protein DFJ74DRAFT_674693 [Hyaloraphidium curvatum]